MRGYLLGADSSEQILHEVHVSHVDWTSFGVIRMNIADLHVGETVLVVIVGAVLGLVNWLLYFSFNCTKNFHLGLVGILKLRFDVVSGRESSSLRLVKLREANHSI